MRKSRAVRALVGLGAAALAALAVARRRRQPPGAADEHTPDGGGTTAAWRERAAVAAATARSTATSMAGRARETLPWPRSGSLPPANAHGHAAGGWVELLASDHEEALGRGRIMLYEPAAPGASWRGAIDLHRREGLDHPVPPGVYRIRFELSGEERAVAVEPDSEGVGMVLVRFLDPEPPLVVTELGGE